MKKNVIQWKINHKNSIQNLFKLSLDKFWFIWHFCIFSVYITCEWEKMKMRQKLLLQLLNFSCDKQNWWHAGGRENWVWVFFSLCQMWKWRKEKCEVKINNDVIKFSYSLAVLLFIIFIRNKSIKELSSAEYCVVKINLPIKYLH